MKWQQSIYQNQLQYLVKGQSSPPIYMQQTKPQLLESTKAEQKESEMEYVQHQVEFPEIDGNKKER